MRERKKIRGQKKREGKQRQKNIRTKVVEESQVCQGKLGESWI